MEIRHGKTPRQARARVRLERVLGAAAELFAEFGYARTSTNRIAERAGVHVPSVYQYFSNKDAIVAELWDRHVDEMIKLLSKTMERFAELSVAATTRLYVVAILQLHAARPALLSVLYQQSSRMENVRDLRGEAGALLVPYFTERKKQLRAVDLEVAAFVLAAAVEGVARQAVSEHAPSQDVLAEEVTHLATAYLGATGTSQGAN